MGAGRGSPVGPGTARTPSPAPAASPCTGNPTRGSPGAAPRPCDPRGPPLAHACPPVHTHPGHGPRCPPYTHPTHCGYRPECPRTPPRAQPTVPPSHPPHTPWVQPPVHLAAPRRAPQQHPRRGGHGREGVQLPWRGRLFPLGLRAVPFPPLPHLDANPPEGA